MNDETCFATTRQRRSLSLSAVLLAIGILWPTTALAQSPGVAVTYSSSFRDVPDGGWPLGVDRGKNPSYISHLDCQQQVVFEFRYTPPPGATGAPTFWVGPKNYSCSDQFDGALSGASAACSRLENVQVTSGGFRVTADEIARSIPGVTNCSGTGDAPIEADVWVIYAGASGFAKTVVDLEGPAPPTASAPVPGDTRLILPVNNVSSDTNIQGYVAYCGIPDHVVEDGGDAGPQGTRPATACSGGLTLDVPMNGRSPLASASGYQCGLFANPPSNNQFVITTDASSAPLVNGSTYAVAVAAYDEVGNVGPMTTVECGAPEARGTTPATKDDVPVAGRGCAVGPSAQSPWTLTGWMALLGLGVLGLRRRVRGRASGAVAARDASQRGSQSGGVL